MDGKRKLLCRGVPHESQKNSFAPSHSVPGVTYLLILQRFQKVHYQLRPKRHRHGEPDSGCRHSSGKSINPIVQSKHSRHYAHSYYGYSSDPSPVTVDRRPHAPAIRYRLPRRAHQCAGGNLHCSSFAFQPGDCIPERHGFRHHCKRQDVRY